MNDFRIPVGHDCTGASSSRRPSNFRPQTDGYRNSNLSENEKTCDVCSVPLLLAALKVIHKKNWKCPDVLEHFHQPIHA